MYCLEPFLAEGSPAAELRAELIALLDAQSSALLAGDDEAFAATFGEAPDEKFVAAASRTAAIPVRSAAITFAEGIAFDSDDTDDDRLGRIDAELVVAFDGVDDNDFRYLVTYDFEIIDDAWAVTDLSFDNDPPFWFERDLIVQESDHFTAFAPPDTTDRLAATVEESEVAYSELVERGLPLEPRYLLLLTVDQGEFRDLTDRGTRTLGVAVSSYSITSDEIAVDNRMFFVNGEALAELVEDGDHVAGNDRPTTVRHELAHLALAIDTRPFTPPWLSEGAATYLARQLTDESRSRLVADPSYGEIDLATLSAAGTLGEDDFAGERVGAEYLFSGEVYRFLVDEFGAEAADSFYRSFADVDIGRVVDDLPPAAPSITVQSAFEEFAVEVTEELLASSFGLDIASLDAAVRARLVG